MTLRRLALAGLWALWTLLAASAAWAQVLPVPALTARVIDQTSTLDATTLAAMEARLAAFERERGTQVVVVLVPTTTPEDIADYTQRLGDAWKIGRAAVGDGLLFVVAKDDRRLRIAPAKALEGALPDVLAHRIIDQVVTPAFRRGDFAGGINAGLDHILARVTGENLPLPAADGAGDSGSDSGDWVVFALFAGPMLLAMLRRVFGQRACALLAGAGVGGVAWWLTQLWWLGVLAGMLAFLASLFFNLVPSLPRSSRGSGRGGWGPPGGGWGGGGSGGFGGGSGGFRSGGGGNFGGGGASGRW